MTKKIVKKNEGTLVEVVGDQHIIKLEGSDTNNTLSVIEQTYQPDTGSILHHHEKDTHVFYVLDGVFELIMDDSINKLSKGDLAYIPNKTKHSFKVIGKTAAKALVITFPAGLEKLFVELSQLNLKDQSINIPEIINKYGVKLN